MKLWLSAEVQNEVSDALRQASNKLRTLLFPQIFDSYGSDIEIWGLITILRPKIPEGWGEVVKYHPEDRSAEFRLIIDYDQFKAASAERQVQMLVGSILRSIDLFPSLKVNGFDIERFRRDILAAVTSARLISSESSAPIPRQ